MNPLPCSTIVFRSITRANDIRDGRPLANAFMLRPLPRDKKGLSVNYNVTIPEGCAPKLSNKKAIASLHVGRIRDIGLDVISDKETHANLTGLPRVEDGFAVVEEAENYAQKLADLSRTVWQRSASQ